MDSILSKVSTDAKADPEFIKPKRRDIPYGKDNHIIMCLRFGLPLCEVLVVHNAHVEQNARRPLSTSSWEHGLRIEILDVAHIILCKDDRFVLCADDHFSASLASLVAIGQIAKQFVVFSITSQESLPVRRNRRSWNQQR